MHIHLPKPIHGWREFFNEVGIIVIGVLLALGAEQIVERLSWRAEVREATEDLHVELQDSLFTSTERLRLRDCIDRQLDQVDAVIDRPPAGRWNFATAQPLRIWSSAAWDSAIASGAVAHMKGEQRADFTSIYAAVRTLRALNGEEFKIRAELSTVGRGGPFSETMRDRLHADVAQLKAYNRLIALAASQLHDSVADAGISMRPEDMKILNGQKCLPVGPGTHAP